MWPFEKKTPYITLGNQRVEVEPMSIQNAIALTLLMAPYWPLLDEHLPNLEHALLEKDLPLLTGVFMVLRDEMRNAPGDIVKAVALLSGIDPEWITRNATAAELIEALSTLDRVHDFKRMWGILRLGSVYLGK